MDVNADGFCYQRTRVFGELSGASQPLRDWSEALSPLSLLEPTELQKITGAHLVHV